MATRLIKSALFFQKPIRCMRSRQNVNINGSNLSLMQVRPVRFYSTKAYEKNGWKTWRGIVSRFVPLGLCLMAVMQWRAYRKQSSTRIAKQWEIDFYCALPLRAISRCWGWIADKQLPESIRPWVYGLYASSFDVDLSEAISSDFKYYPSLADFFARELKEGVRTIDSDNCLTSPCDGKVLHFGPVNSCHVEQVKGVTYSLEQFLGNYNGKKSMEKYSDYRTSLLHRTDNKPTALYQCILYLAPGDYHRFHSPTDWEPAYRKHFSGELLSVSPTVARWIPGLFTLNERAVYLGQWKHGFFSFTAVGATNVGSVKVYFDKNLQTNCTGLNQCQDACLPTTVKLNKGDLIGEFRMGSTIVLIFEAPINFEFNLAAGQTVRVGQGIGSVRKIKYVDKVQKPSYNVMKSAS